jgi:hypothetical protein
LAVLGAAQLTAERLVNTRSKEQHAWPTTQGTTKIRRRLKCAALIEDAAAEIKYAGLIADDLVHPLHHDAA